MKNLNNFLNSFNFGGVSFVSIKEYSSDSSGNTEVSNVLLNVGASYEKAKEKDIARVKELDVKKIANSDFDVVLLKKAKEEMLKSLISPSENRSNGQKDAYVQLANGIKFALNTENLLIWGKLVRKDVLVKGERKTVNSKPLTLAKKFITKALDLETAKFRQYKAVVNAEKVVVRGDTFEM